MIAGEVLTTRVPISKLVHGAPSYSGLSGADRAVLTVLPSPLLGLDFAQDDRLYVQSLKSAKATTTDCHSQTSRKMEKRNRAISCALILAPRLGTPEAASAYVFDNDDCEDSSSEYIAVASVSHKCIGVIHPLVSGVIVTFESE